MPSKPKHKPINTTERARRALKAAKLAAAARGQTLGVRADGSKKVFWDPEEKTKIAHAGALLVTRGAGTLATRGGCQLINAAQQFLIDEGLLAPDRKRDIKALKTEPWFREQAQAELDRQKLEQQRDVLDVQIAEAQRVEDEQRADEQRREEQAQREAEKLAANEQLLHAELRKYATPLARLIAVVDDAKEFLTEALAQILAGGFSRATERIRAGGVEPQERSAPAKTEFNGHDRTAADLLRKVMNSGAAPSTKTRKPAVLIVGLKGAQEGVMEAEFGDKLDLRFQPTNANKFELREKASAAEVTVGFTDFMSHAVEAVIQSRAARYIKSPGGLNGLRSILNNLVLEETHLEATH